MSAAVGSFTHGVSAYRNHRCRCAVCTDAHRLRMNAEQVDRLRRTRDNGGVAPVATHNDLTYRNWGCRCPTCREAHRACMNAEKHGRIGRTKDNGGVAPTSVHNAFTYSNWGCRCTECVRANAEMRRQHRARLRERAS